ncbi:hypothetical protein IKF74_01775 [Candidatus Saccharibacteria bacterium]|nr:hypothetical protein [Candidatus Saccharibacteria bacterium]
MFFKKLRQILSSKESFEEYIVDKLLPRVEERKNICLPLSEAEEKHIASRAEKIKISMDSVVFYTHDIYDRVVETLDIYVKPETATLLSNYNLELHTESLSGIGNFKKFVIPYEAAIDLAQGVKFHDDPEKKHPHGGYVVGYKADSSIPSVLSVREPNSWPSPEEEKILFLNMTLKAPLINQGSSFYTGTEFPDILELDARWKPESPESVLALHLSEDNFNSFSFPASEHFGEHFNHRPGR